MCRIILCKPQREEDKLIDHEEERRQTHPDITNMISPVLTHISLKFYYRKYMLRKKKSMDFDNPKVYGDTFISDGLVFLNFFPGVRDTKSIVDNLESLSEML